MMMHFSGTVNTAQEEHKYCLSTPTVRTQNSPSTLSLFQNPLSAKIETCPYLLFTIAHCFCCPEICFQLSRVVTRLANLKKSFHRFDFRSSTYFFRYSSS